jgi:flagellin-specific chaperone FliS
MAVALHHCRRNSGALPASLRGGAPVLSLLLVDEALERLGCARAAIGRGCDPHHHLRLAALRIGRLASVLTPPADEAAAAESALIANLDDMAQYICRRLAGVHDATGLSTLADMCDLLREIRRAWVTPPAAAAILCGTAAARA